MNAGRDGTGAAITARCALSATRALGRALPHGTLIHDD